MKLSKILLKGYRNFKDATINIENKSLIIGSNDVGKTNLLWAIRILLDRSLNDFDIEPKDSDFFAYEETNQFEITLCFENVTEDCVVSKLKGKISDNDDLFLCYRAYRDRVTKTKEYKLFAGHSLDNLDEIEERYYRKVLNVKYISSRRDLHGYINQEKNTLFQLAKEKRTGEELEKDNELFKEIQSDLKKVDEQIPNLKFISSATETLNEELNNLSFHNRNQAIVFDTNASNVDKFINNLTISSKSHGQNVVVGGDGRLNQIYLALWASRNEIKEEKIEEVTLVCIEEPEAHLHPHQQRKLAEYLNNTIKGQVILTSHSPQIASEFNPNSIVRLFTKNNSSKAASEGCSPIITKAFHDFGYRLSIIPAEAFFADVVLLVEGSSEEIFYKTLAKQHDVDLDNLNISVLMIDGVGFSTYIDILNALEIEWVLRTDNDIFKVPHKEVFRYAGIQRCIGFYRKSYEKSDEMEIILKQFEAYLTGFSMEEPSHKRVEASNEIRKALEKFNMFISNIDLENDLFDTEIAEDLRNYFENIPDKDIVSEMQKHKATFMFNFLKENKDVLIKLKSNYISKPIKKCVRIVKTLHDDSN